MAEILDKIWKKVENWLNIRPHSKWEVEQYIIRKIDGWISIYKAIGKRITKDELHDLLLQRICRDGYINDKAFSAWWVKQRIEFKQYGSLKLKEELFSKHVDSKVIDEVLKDMVEPIEKSLAKKMYKKLRKRYTDREKLILALLRKGFSYSLVDSIVL